MVEWESVIWFLGFLLLLGVVMVLGRKPARGERVPTIQMTRANYVFAAAFGLWILLWIANQVLDFWISDGIFALLILAILGLYFVMKVRENRSH